MRVTTEEAPPVVVVSERGYGIPVLFNRPPAVTLTAVYAEWRRQYRIKGRPGER